MNSFRHLFQCKFMGEKSPFSTAKDFYLRYCKWPLENMSTAEVIKFFFLHSWCALPRVEEEPLRLPYLQ